MQLAAGVRALACGSMTITNRHHQVDGLAQLKHSSHLSKQGDDCAVQHNEAGGDAYAPPYGQHSPTVAVTPRLHHCSGLLVHSDHLNSFYSRAGDWWPMPHL
jgi:hypothetical protein